MVFSIQRSSRRDIEKAENEFHRKSPAHAIRRAWRALTRRFRRQRFASPVQKPDVGLHGQNEAPAPEPAPAADPPLAEDEEANTLSGLTTLGSYEVHDVLKSVIYNPPANIPLSAYDHDYTKDVNHGPRPSSHTTLDQQETEIGNWPRRLLHVPTMISLEWQPGNLYGDHVAPKYSAVSYTWGRYNLDNPGAKRPKKFRNVRGIGIKGIDWPVPRINPDQQFTVDELQHLIHQTCKPVIDNDVKTDFLWLDVACIDQNEGPQKDAEIGRQAVIFHGAHRVFVWLTRLRTERLIRSVSDLFQSADTAIRFTMTQKEHQDVSDNMMSWIGDARTSLDDIFMDPWFTSLWTLQEAFLCQNAYLVALEAQIVRVIPTPKSIASPATLGALCTTAATVHEIVERQRVSIEGKWQEDKQNAQLSKQLKFLSEVSGMVTQRGLTALASQSPMALYSVAQYRRSMNDKDRVYGIQQVFDFRLGASAPGYFGSTKDFNRFVLEDQLGVALLERYEAKSQLHVFTEPVEGGRGWRISSSSIVPRLDIKSHVWDLEIQPDCQLSTKKIQGQRWGRFSGRTCNFAQLAGAWRESHVPRSALDYQRSISPQQIILDTVLKRKRHYDDPEGLVWSDARNRPKEVPRGQQQHRLASALLRVASETFPGGPLEVLLLGHFVELQDKYCIGLILIRVRTEATMYWRRLGICIWQYEYNGNILAADAMLNPHLVEGDTSTPWIYRSDLFG